MKKIIITLGFALTMLIGANASAGPISVDCNTLRTAIHNSDAYLDANSVSFASLGDLVSTAFLDSTQGGNLVTLINVQYQALTYLTSGPFASPKQLFTTIASCGLTPFLIAEIND